MEHSNESQLNQKQFKFLTSLYNALGQLSQHSDQMLRIYQQNRLYILKQLSVWIKELSGHFRVKKQCSKISCTCTYLSGMNHITPYSGLQAGFPTWLFTSMPSSSIKKPQSVKIIIYLIVNLKKNNNHLLVQCMTADKFLFTEWKKRVSTWAVWVNRTVCHF
jgi:hypothetical protein